MDGYVQLDEISRDILKEKAGKILSMYGYAFPKSGKVL